MFTESKEEPHHNCLVSWASFSVLYQRRLGHGPRDLFKFVENHETVYAMGQEYRFKKNACCYGQKDVVNCEQIHINYSLLLDYKSPIMLKDIKLTWTKTSSANTQVYRTEDDGDAIINYDIQTGNVFGVLNTNGRSFSFHRCKDIHILKEFDLPKIMEREHKVRVHFEKEGHFPFVDPPQK